jgi:hypothetical protein
MNFWRRSFWKDYWIALRRSREDRRARAFAFKLTLLLAYIVAYLGWLTYFITSEPAGGWILVVGVLPAFVVRLLMKRSHQRDDDALNFSIVGNVREQIQVAPSKEVSDYLAERTFIIATLVLRGSSEVCLRNRATPVAAPVATRQTLNRALRENGLWGKLEPAEATLAGAPDGVWPAEQSNPGVVMTWCEQLRLLRWTLRIDAELMPLAHLPKFDISAAAAILAVGKIPAPGGVLLTSADLLVERDIAGQYAARAIAEMHNRRMLKAASEFDGPAAEFREHFLGPSNDLLVGTKTVEELEDSALRQIGIVAVGRSQYCAYLTSQLSANAPIPFSSFRRDGGSRADSLGEDR